MKSVQSSPAQFESENVKGSRRWKRIVLPAVLPLTGTSEDPVTQEGLGYDGSAIRGSSAESNVKENSMAGSGNMNENHAGINSLAASVQNPNEQVNSFVTVNGSALMQVTKSKKTGLEEQNMKSVLAQFVVNTRKKFFKKFKDLKLQFSRMFLENHGWGTDAEAARTIDDLFSFEYSKARAMLNNDHINKMVMANHMKDIIRPSENFLNESLSKRLEEGFERLRTGVNLIMKSHDQEGDRMGLFTEIYREGGAILPGPHFIPQYLVGESQPASYSHGYNDQQPLHNPQGLHEQAPEYSAEYNNNKEYTLPLAKDLKLRLKINVSDLMPEPIYGQ